jgi:hypothetical protein
MNAILRFIPILFVLTGIYVPLMIVLIRIAKRKGKSPGLWAFLALIPGVNVIAPYWLVAQTDISVLREIEEIKKRLPS